MVTETHIATEEKKNQILTRLLAASAQGAFVSGNELSDLLGVSRTAVWKHIRAYEEVGFEFESVPRLGYRLKSAPDILLGPILNSYLTHDITLGRSVHWFATMDSTNSAASKMARENAPHGTIVAAGVQTGGRGRRGRPWFSPKEGLWFSLILKRPMPLGRAAELTLLASVALRRAIMSLTSLSIDIKWPNDLLVNGKKVCGILAEIRADGETVHTAVLGIGVNCNTPSESFPDELKDIATSLYGESGSTVNRAALTAEFLRQFEPMLNGLVSGGPGFRDVNEEWKQASATLGKWIKVQTPQQLLEGLAVDMSDTGVLYLQTDDGVTHSIHSGDVLF